MLGGVHNPIVTPDSKFVVAGSIGGALATVIDTQLERPVWSIHFNDGEGVRVFCFDWNPDGSTRRMFVQLSNFHGFAVVDWEKRKGSAADHAAGDSGRRAEQGRHPGRPGAWHPRHARRQADLDDEQVEQPRLRVRDAGPEITSAK